MAPAAPILDPTYTWTYSRNNSFGNTGGKQGDYRSCVLGFKNLLVAMGFVVVGSSDGTTAGLDAVDRWAAVGNLFWGTGAGALSWIVLRHPLYTAAQYSILITLNGSYTSSYEQIGIVVAHDAAFTGGSTTTRPTSTTEMQIWGLQTAWLGAFTTATVAMHAMYSSDNKCHRIFAYISNVPVLQFWIEEPLDKPTAWVTAAPLITRFISSTSGSVDQMTFAKLTQGSNSGTRINGTNRSTNASLAPLSAGNLGLGSHYTETALTPDEISGKYAASPLIYIMGTTGSRGYLGKPHDMWFVQSATLVEGDYYTADAGATRKLIVMGQLLLPWESASQLATPTSQAGTSRSIDDIYSGRIPPVAAAVVPNLSSATQIDATTIELIFDSSMANDAELVDIDNYQVIDPASVAQITATAVRINATTVRITTLTLENGVTYEVRVCNLSDLLGNFIRIGPAKNRASFLANADGPGIPPVLTGPTLSSATAISSTVVELVFDSDLANDAELIDVDNYQIIRPSSSLLVTVSVARINATTVRVTCEEMQNGVTYEVRVCNVQDLGGDYILVGPNKNQRSFTGLGSGPSVVLVAPADGATGVVRGTGIVIEITDAASGVDIDSVVVAVEGVDAFNGGTFGDGFADGVSKLESITNGYRITLDPDDDFSFGQVVNIVVTGSDLAGNPIT